MFLRLLEQTIRNGIINLHMPSGQVHRFGEQGREVDWVINNEQAMKLIARDWEFQLGETYMQGQWDVKAGQLQDLLSVLRANFSELVSSHWKQFFLRIIQQWNNVSRSYRNVHSHYDLDEDMFRLFLDQDMHYSCAYFRDQNNNLEMAQADKCRHIAEKLLLQPGQRVLDIGCGWGAFALYLASLYDVEVTGITLSKAQLDVAKRRARQLGLNNVQFQLQDYREHRQQYDRIVSIGMFEHVGKPYYSTFFSCVKSMLREDGVALIHSIGRSGTPGRTNPWINKYIFPGGSIPALSEMSRSAEHVKLILTDIEVLRLHYAYTLRAWYERFQHNRQQVRDKMGEPFCRMWEFYLSACEVAFQFSDLVVYQLQLTRQHHIVPITRDYLYPSDSDSLTMRRQA